MNFTTDVKNIFIVSLQKRWEFEITRSHLVQAFCKDMKGCKSISEFIEKELHNTDYRALEISITVPENQNSQEVLDMIEKVWCLSPEFYFTIHHPKDNHIIILMAYKETK